MRYFVLFGLLICLFVGGCGVRNDRGNFLSSEKIEGKLTLIERSSYADPWGRLPGDERGYALGEKDVKFCLSAISDIKKQVQALQQKIELSTNPPEQKTIWLTRIEKINYGLRHNENVLLPRLYRAH